MLHVRVHWGVHERYPSKLYEELHGDHLRPYAMKIEAPCVGTFDMFALWRKATVMIPRSLSDSIASSALAMAKQSAFQNLSFAPQEWMCELKRQTILLHSAQYDVSVALQEWMCELKRQTILLHSAQYNVLLPTSVQQQWQISIAAELQAPSIKIMP